MTYIIAVTQHKGGTGKTTSVLNLGAALAGAGSRVLLVDLDPQADLSAGLGVVVDIQKKTPTLYTILGFEEGLLSQIIVSTSWPKLDLAPGTLDMVDLEARLTQVLGRERMLEGALKEVASRYDYILLDCPPSLGLINANALVAADAVLIPVAAEPRSVRAVDRVLAAVDLVERKLNNRLKVLGMLITMTNGTNVARDATALLRQQYGDAVLNTSIKERTQLKEDTLYRAPVLAFAPKSESAEEYRALAAEVLQRVQRREASTVGV